MKKLNVLIATMKTFFVAGTASTSIGMITMAPEFMIAGISAMIFGLVFMCLEAVHSTQKEN